MPGPVYAQDYATGAQFAGLAYLAIHLQAIPSGLNGQALAEELR